MNPIRGTLIGGLIGAVVFVVVGTILRFMIKHWVVTTVVIGSLTIAYKYGPTGQVHRAAEQVMKGTPTEEAVAEAEERGEEAKPDPKITVSNLVLIDSAVARRYERNTVFEAVEVDVTNSGPVAVEDIGITCTFMRPGDDPRDEPHWLKGDKVEFLVLNPGETRRLRYTFAGLAYRSIIKQSFNCKPWWLDVNSASVAKAAGYESLTSEVATSFTTGSRPVREHRRDFTMATVSGTVTNQSKDRWVRNISINCETEQSGRYKDSDKGLHTVKIEIGPGETKTFAAQDLEQYEQNFGQSFATTCRLDHAVEETAEEHAAHVAADKAEAEKLARMTPLERKRYRESTGTPWGRVRSLWR